MIIRSRGIACAPCVPVQGPALRPGPLDRIRVTRASIDAVADLTTERDANDRRGGNHFFGASGVKRGPRRYVYTLGQVMQLAGKRTPDALWKHLQRDGVHIDDFPAIVGWLAAQLRKREPPPPAPPPPEVVPDTPRRRGMAPATTAILERYTRIK